MYCSRRIGLLALVCIGIWEDVAAADWALKGFLGQQLQYNDNISLSTIRKDSVFGYLLTPSIQASRKTAVWDITFDGQGDIRRYDDTHWDCDNYNLNLNNAYRTKRGVFSLSGGYGVSCAYSQQLTDTGLLEPLNQSENYRLSPSWTWQWTSRDQLLLNTIYNKTSYTNNSTASNTNNDSLIFSGNDIYSVTLGETHEWSRLLSLNGNLFYSNVQYTGSNTSTQNVFGFELGANYKINHFWAVSLGGGPRWVDTTEQSSDNSSSGQNPSLTLGNSANIGLSYDDRLSRFSIGFSSSLSPSGIGQTLQNYSAFVSYSYQLTQHLLFDLSSNFTTSQSVGDSSTVSQFDRSYFTASAGIGWEFAKNWELRGSYIYNWQDYQQDNAVQNFQVNSVQNFNVGTSNSNALMVFLNYSWDGIQSSHRERQAGQIPQQVTVEKKTRRSQSASYTNIKF